MKIPIAILKLHNFVLESFFRVAAYNEDIQIFWKLSVYQKIQFYHVNKFM